MKQNQLFCLKLEHLLFEINNEVVFHYRPIMQLLHILSSLELSSNASVSLEAGALSTMERLKNLFKPVATQMPSLKSKDLCSKPDAQGSSIYFEEGPSEKQNLLSRLVI